MRSNAGEDTVDVAIPITTAPDGVNYQQQMWATVTQASEDESIRLELEIAKRYSEMTLGAAFSKYLHRITIGVKDSETGARATVPINIRNLHDLRAMSMLWDGTQLGLVHRISGLRDPRSLYAKSLTGELLTRYPQKYLNPRTNTGVIERQE